MRRVMVVVLGLALWLVQLVAEVQGAPCRPDFSSCGLVKHTDVNCCHIKELMHKGRYGPAVYKEWAEYLREKPLPAAPRLRRAAHLGAASNRTYLHQLNRAYQMMQALPEDDPRSIWRQNTFHCMYGGLGVEKQLGHPDKEYTVHTNWLFHPFHRWFTFFYERTLAKLVGDDTFALPFWNWDNQAPTQPLLPNVLPFFMRDPETFPALYHQPRDPRHDPGQRPQIVPLDPLLYKSMAYQQPYPETDDIDEVRRRNNYHLHNFMVARSQSDISAFLSKPIRAGERTALQGEWENFEARIHANVHNWVGDYSLDLRDFGASYRAVLDPLFFLHHTNVDRLWTVWQDELKRPGYVHDPDWMEADFFFSDENGEWVRVTVADCLDWRRLGIVYEEVENTWISYDGPPPSYLETTTSSSNSMNSELIVTKG